MDHYKVIVRDDEYEEAFLSVGRFLKMLDQKNARVTIVKDVAPVYIVQMPAGVISEVRKHGDVVEVIGMI